MDSPIPARAIAGLVLCLAAPFATPNYAGSSTLDEEPDPIPCGTSTRRTPLMHTGFGSGPDRPLAGDAAVTNWVVNINGLRCDVCEGDPDPCFQTNSFFGDLLFQVLYEPPAGQPGDVLMSVQSDPAGEAVKVIVGCEACP